MSAPPVTDHTPRLTLVSSDGRRSEVPIVSGLDFSLVPLPDESRKASECWQSIGDAAANAASSFSKITFTMTGDVDGLLNWNVIDVRDTIWTPVFREERIRLRHDQRGPHRYVVTRQDGSHVKTFRRKGNAERAMAACDGVLTEHGRGTRRWLRPARGVDVATEGYDVSVALVGRTA